MNHNPYIIKPNGRSVIRTGDGRIEILVGGKWDYYTWPILLDGVPILPVSVEKVTNIRSGYPFHKITIEGVEFGKHSLQIDGSYNIIFYVNPLY